MFFYAKRLVRKLLASRRRRLVLPAMLVSFSLFVGIFLQKREAAANRLGAWRSSSLLEESLRASERGDWHEARRAALASWQLRPGPVETLSQLFLALQRTGHIAVVEVAKALYAHPQAGASERLEATRFFLATGDHVAVSKMLSDLGPNERDLPEALDLRVRFLLARDQPLPALLLVDKLRGKRSEKADLLLAAEVMLRLPSEGDRALAEAQRILDELFASTDEPRLALEAFLLLRRVPFEKRAPLLFGNARERLAEIERKLAVPATAWLLAEEIEMGSRPEDREAILDAATHRWREKEPLALGQWLLGLGETKRILERYPRRETLRQPELVPLLVQALVVENEWDRALALLDRASGTADPLVVHSLRAMIQARTGTLAESKQNWIRALRHAELSNGPEALMRLARLAALGGNGELRDRAVAAALKRPSAVPVAAADVSYLFPGLIETDRDEDLLDVSLGLLASQPDNPQLLNNVVWLELVKGRLDQEKVARLEAVAARFPSITGLRTTLALARLREGRAEEALEQFVSDAPDHGKGAGLPASTADRAVLALALAENGEPERARAVADSIEWTDLMKVERSYFIGSLEESLDEDFELE